MLSEVVDRRRDRRDRAGIAPDDRRPSREPPDRSARLASRRVCFVLQGRKCDALARDVTAFSLVLQHRDVVGGAEQVGLRAHAVVDDPRSTR